jgi:hypothetical protein
MSVPPTGIEAPSAPEVVPECEKVRLSQKSHARAWPRSSCKRPISVDGGTLTELTDRRTRRRNPFRNRRQLAVREGRWANWLRLPLLAQPASLGVQVLKVDSLSGPAGLPAACRSIARVSWSAPARVGYGSTRVCEAPVVVAGGQRDAVSVWASAEAGVPWPSLPSRLGRLGPAPLHHFQKGLGPRASIPQ